MVISRKTLVASWGHRVEGEVGGGMLDADRRDLGAFVRSGSAQAFDGLVRRYADAVYGVCLRRLGRPEDAEDAAQAAFIVLARKARSVRPESLASWLHGTAMRAAAKTASLNARRVRREEEAAKMRTAVSAAPDSPAPGWEDARPHLDGEIARLPEKSREALIRHYFAGRSYRELAAELRVSEGTAAARVSRALERLRKRFRKRGVALGAAGLGPLLAAEAQAAAPASLGASVSALASGGSAALAAAGAGSKAGLAAKEVLRMMVWERACRAAALGAALVVGAAVPFTIRAVSAGEAPKVGRSSSAPSRKGAEAQAADVKKKPMVYEGAGNAKKKTGKPPKVAKSTSMSKTVSLKAKWASRLFDSGPYPKPRDQKRLVLPYGAVWSGDGRTLCHALKIIARERVQFVGKDGKVHAYMRPVTKYELVVGPVDEECPKRIEYQIDILRKQGNQNKDISFSLSPDGKVLALALPHPTEVQLMDAKSGKITRTFSPKDLAGDGDAGMVESLTFSLDGKDLFLGTLSRGIWKLNLRKGESSRVLKKDWSIPNMSFVGRDRIRFSSVGTPAPMAVMAIGGNAKPARRFGASVQVRHLYEMNIKNGAVRKLANKAAGARQKVNIQLKSGKMIKDVSLGNMPSDIQNRVFAYLKLNCASVSPDGKHALIQECYFKDDRSGRRLYLVEIEKRASSDR